MMNNIFFYSEDADECISGYKALSDEMRSDLAEIRKIRSELDVRSCIYRETEYMEETLKAQINTADELVRILAAAKEKYEMNEEQIMTDIKRKLFLNRGNIIVEKSLEAGKSSLLCTNTLCHDERLVRMIFEKMAGEK